MSFMRRRFQEIAFTANVQAEQVRQGSREMFSGADDATGAEPALSARESDFIRQRDSFYLASVSETGWPYMQHRGGPAGFVRQLDATTIGWAEYAGNRQYVSVGNVAANDRVALFFMDYPNRRRLKVLGHMRAAGLAEDPDLARTLAVAGTRARIERSITVTIEAFDWNCPQHITPRYTLAEIAAMRGSD